MQAIERARLKPLSSCVLAWSSFSRNATGSAFAAAASSSMKLSDANVTCGPSGSRRLPVRSGVSNGIGSGTTRVVCGGSESRTCPTATTRGRATAWRVRVPISCAISTVSCSL